MKTRKLVLIIADVVLAAILLLQLLFGARSGVKTVYIKGDVDSLMIQTPENTLNLSKYGEGWVIEEGKIAADADAVQRLVDAVSSVKLLDKVATAGTQTSVEKYGFEDGKKTVVTASSNGKVLRTITLGKESVASSQSYIMLDSSNEVYLASGGLKNAFAVDAESLKAPEPKPADTAENDLENASEGAEPSIVTE